MSLRIETDVDLTAFNTLGIPSSTAYFARITSENQLTEAEAAAQERGVPLVTIGDGSNIVFGTPKLNCLLIKIEIKGREIIEQSASATTVKLGAGESWDEFVEWAVGHNLRGIESLSLVPGTVGAAPVQNVGAYGQEVSETITEVTVYDRKEQVFRTLSNADCQFGYRDSVFKHSGKHRYIVTHVTFKLLAETEAPPPTYASLQAELDHRGITEPTVHDIRESVIAIRTAKLPDPAKIPTAGSFFHNPVVEPTVAQRLEGEHPELPHWPAGGRVKLSAPWLVEQCGFKGMIEDGVGIYDKQAICLVNPGHRPAGVVLAFRDRIMAAVKERFGITLAMEPELITVEAGAPAQPPNPRSR